MQGVDETLLATVIDRDAITHCLALYCRGIDRRDRKLLESVYWPGAVDDHANYVGDADGFIDWVLPLLDGIELTQHALALPLIMIEGNGATAETCFTAYHRIALDGVLHDVMLGGRYVDRFEKRGQEWRIAHRLMLGDWHHSAIAPAGGWESFALGALPAANTGLGGAGDPSTDFLSTHWALISGAS